MKTLKVYRSHDPDAPVDCQRCEAPAEFMVADNKPLWKACVHGYTSLCGKCIKELGFRKRVMNKVKINSGRIKSE